MKKKHFFALGLALVVVLALGLVGYKYLRDVVNPRLEQERDVQSVNTDSAPDFAVVNEAGETVRLSDYLGQPVIINFWASWCGPCCEELPEFQASYEAHGEDVVFLMVNLTDGGRETLEGAKGFVKEQGYTFPVLFDTGLEAAEAYKIYSIPTTITVAPDGRIVSRYTGSMNGETLEGLLTELEGID